MTKDTFILLLLRGKFADLVRSIGNKGKTANNSFADYCEQFGGYIIPSILYIEDNPAEIRLVQEIFHLLNAEVNFLVSSNGQDGMNFLMKKGNYSDSASPHLIFTDINIPENSGFELMRKIKQEDALNMIPIVVLTSSEYPEDIMLCYTLQANAVVFKDSDLNIFLNTMKCVLDFFIYSPYSFYNTTLHNNNHS